MDLPLALEQRAKVEEFQRKHRIGLLTLLFTDLVGSTKLKQELGDRTAVGLIQEHRAVVREILSRFPEGEEIETAGDSFFIVFARPSDAVQFSLLLQHQLRRQVGAMSRPLLNRIGIHVGEVVIEEKPDSIKPKDLYGLQVDVCARVVSLAEGDQILLTRSAFDNARQVLKGEAIEGVGALSWLNHGPYVLKGVDEPMEICEVGELNCAVLKAPSDSDKVHRFVSPDAEPVLGWRPAIGQGVPGTSWVLEEKLGEGGFGEVWLGQHKTTKQRRVFKFCFRADRVRSLRREVTLFRVMKERLGEHPHIVGVQDVYLEEAPYYLTMEYVAGRDLKTWSEARLPAGASAQAGGGVGAIPLETRLEIVAQVAEALQAAHDAGVIHRDVKPSNILVSADVSRPADAVECGGLTPLSSEEGRESSGENQSAVKPAHSTIQAKLTDFGIGQVVSEEVLAGVTRLGFTETLLSTGRAGQAGTYLYMAPELLAGKSASKQSDIYSLGVVLYQLLVGDLSRPITTDWSKEIADPLLREDLARCTAGKPEERFPRGSELAQNLRSLDQRRTGRALEEALRRAEEEARQRQLAEEHNRRLQAACDQARRADERAQIEAELRNDRLSENRLGQASPTSELDDALSEATQQANVLLLTGQPDQAAALHAQALDTRVRVLGSEHPDTLASMYNLGIAYRDQGKLIEAATQHAQVLEIQKRVLGLEHRDTLTSMNYLAFVHQDEGKYDEAATLHAQVLHIRKRVLGPEHPETLVSMNNLALVYHAQGKLVEAATFHAEVLEIRRRRLSPEHRNTLASMNWLAFVLQDQGKYAEAARLHAQVLDIKRRVLGLEHSATLTSVENLAAVYEAQGKWVEAAKLRAQVLEIQKRLLGGESRATLTSMSNLAAAYQAQGKLGEAAALYAQAVAIQRRVPVVEHLEMLASMNNLALVYHAQRKLDDAMRLHTEILEILKRLGADHRDTVASMNNLANVYRSQGRLSEASALYAQVLDIRKRVLGAEHADTLLSMLSLAVVYHAQGKLTEAETLHAQMLGIQRRVLGPEHPDTLMGMYNPVILDHTRHQKLASLLILLGVGEESASSFLQQLEEQDCDRLEAEIDKLPALTTEQQRAVLKEFLDLALSWYAALGGSVEYTRAVLEKSVGVDRASAILSRIGSQRTSLAPERRASAAVVERTVNQLRAVRSKSERIQAERSKLELDFDFGQAERIMIEVLKQLIRENPVKMGLAAGQWLSGTIEAKPYIVEVLSGLQKLAALLILMGEDSASILFKHFEDHEHESVARAMANLSRLTLEQQTEVLKAFTELAPVKEFEARFHGPPAKPVLPPKGDELEEFQTAQRKSALDFGLVEPPERITIGVLKQLILEHPMKLSQAARVWLSGDTRE